MPTLVLLPGLDGTGELFADFIAAMGDRVEPLVISYPPLQPMDYNALEHWVRTRLPVNKPFVLLGESFSGPIAIAIAARPPQNLHGLILCCSFAHSPLRVPSTLRVIAERLPVKRMPSALVTAALLGRFGSTKVKLALRHAIAAVSPEVFHVRLRSMFNVDVRTDARNVKVPALYLRAKSDRLVPRARSAEIKQCISHCQIVDISGPHALLQCAPGDAAAALTKFLAGNSSHSH